MQNLGILAAAYVATLFVSNMLALFLVPAIIAVITVGIYCVVLPDTPITERPAARRLRRDAEDVLGQPEAAPRLRLGLDLPLPDDPRRVLLHHLPVVLPAGRDRARASPRPPRC